MEKVSGRMIKADFVKHLQKRVQRDFRSRH